MPVTTSYPGLYIQELPSNSHTITASPTSVTVFVGYTHPFKTDPTLWGVATEIFSFTDYQQSVRRPLYERSNAVARRLCGKSVLLNGGADAIIVALRPSYYDAPGNNHGLVSAPTL
jgi:uncharacterized protein